MFSIRQPRLIYWDFDGVIKESVEVKSTAFERLFQSHGSRIMRRVRAHHEANGGMSRFEKIPRYLEWAGNEPTPELVDAYCRQFALLARQAVIDAPWVPGAEAFLRGNPYAQSFVLVTATPKTEIEDIVDRMNLRSCFTSIYGAPATKSDSIRVNLAERQIDAQQCLMIGDALADLHAAQANRVPFLLRRHRTNRQVFAHYDGDSVEDFAGLVDDCGTASRSDLGRSGAA